MSLHDSSLNYLLNISCSNQSTCIRSAYNQPNLLKESNTLQTLNLFAATTVALVSLDIQLQSDMHDPSINLDCFCSRLEKDRFIRSYNLLHCGFMLDFNSEEVALNSCTSEASVIVLFIA